MHILFLLVSFLLPGSALAESVPNIPDRKVARQVNGDHAENDRTGKQRATGQCRAEGRVLRAGHDIVALVRTPPEYPEEARMRYIQGYVDVEFTVDKKGRVRNAVVVEASPPDVFDSAALKSVKRWRFEPMRQAGSAVEVVACQRFEFQIESLPMSMDSPFFLLQPPAAP